MASARRSSGYTLGMYSASKKPSKKRASGLNVREEYTAALKQGVTHPLRSSSTQRNDSASGIQRASHQHAARGHVTDHVHTQVFGEVVDDDTAYAGTMGLGDIDDDYDPDDAYADMVATTNGFGASTSLRGSKGLRTTRSRKQKTVRDLANEGVRILEPEAMAQEIFNLKKHIMAHEQERKLTNADLQRTQREKAKLESDLKAMASATDNRSAALVVSLKQVVRSLRQELANAQHDLAAVRDDVKHTNITDLQTMCKVYYEESQRLKLLLASGSGTNAGAYGGLDGAGGDTSHIKPSADTLRKLKNENRFLKDEIAELKADYGASLDTLHKLRENMQAPPPMSGDKSKYNDMSREDLAEKIVELENTIVLLQAQNRGLESKQESADGKAADLLRTHGFDSAEDVVSLRREIDHLRHENQRLLTEAEGSVASQLSAGGVSATRASPAAVPNLVVKAAAVNEATEETHAGETKLQGTVSMATVLDAPTVPQPTIARSGAGATLEKQRVDAAQQQRKLYLAQHKGEVDAAITQIQKAIRGHFARRRLISDLKRRGMHSTSSPRNTNEVVTHVGTEAQASSTHASDARQRRSPTSRSIASLMVDSDGVVERPRSSGYTASMAAMSSDDDADTIIEEIDTYQDSESDDF